MSGAAQEEAEMEALVARVSAAVLSAVAATLRAELAELRSLSQEVPELVAPN